MFNNKSFDGGIIFKADGQPGAMPIEQLPPPPLITIPLLQHTFGTPARPIVKAGDRVSMGQIIGESCDNASAPVHAPVSGTVTRILRDHNCPKPQAFCVQIENDDKEEFSSPIPYDRPWMESSAEELIRKIERSGIIDLGGKPTPLHVKLSRKGESPVRTLLVNAVADEALLPPDYRMIIEQADNVLTGILICKQITGASECLIAVNALHTGLIEVLTGRLADAQFSTIALVKMRTKYPLHDDNLLREIGNRVQPDQRWQPADTLIISPMTAAWVRDAVCDLAPLYQRVVTVAGPLAATPKNLLVRIGTPMRLLLEAAGVDLTKTTRLISGSLISGSAIADLNDPVLKSTASLTALGTESIGMSRTCISCRACLVSCPMRLAPSRLVKLARDEDFAELLNWNIASCIECGSCAYVCPSKINLLHYIRHGKHLVSKETATA
ncbi:MAG: RnfABCDGE type electron transport complex subunit C [Chitinispirillaceae bacterium]|nr:RnfABCDGE type electron transport complex subunit C [Chitinispirillaceae bacterium]